MIVYNDTRQKENSVTGKTTTQTITRKPTTTTPIAYYLRHKESSIRITVECLTSKRKALNCKHIPTFTLEI